MNQSNLNIYDYIEFPNTHRRNFLRKEYGIFSELRQVDTSILEKYDDKTVPYEFIDYNTTVSTWINEYNHAIFALSIPLYQMIDIYHQSLFGNPSKEQLLCSQMLINYYSEIIAYYVDCAFKKSVNIFNSMFRLNVNDSQKSFNEIIQEVKNKSKDDLFINRVYQELRRINDNNYYKEILGIRNKNTHSVRPTQQGFIDEYDKKTGITAGYITKSIGYKRIVEIIVGAIKLLGEYTKFINNLEEEYYEFLYENYLMLVDEEQ